MTAGSPLDKYDDSYDGKDDVDDVGEDAPNMPNTADSELLDSPGAVKPDDGGPGYTQCAEWKDSDKAWMGVGGDSESDRAKPDPESGPVLNSMEIIFEDAELELNISSERSADEAINSTRSVHIFFLILQ